MTAARVLNPVIISELCKMGASPAKMGRNFGCGRQLTRIKRDLFGPVNPVEINKIFNEEIEKQQEQAKKKWGFDFCAGAPLVSNNNSQYIWERVSFQESTYAPEVYTLTRSAHVRPATAVSSAMELLMDERSECENSSLNSSSATDTDSCDELHEEPELLFKIPAVVPSSAIAPCTLTFTGVRSPARKRQPKITEFMKQRKRLAQTVKKISPPAKRLRTSSGGNSIADERHTRAAHAQPFSMRK